MLQRAANVLETLEGRRLLSNVSWVGPGGTWNDATKWSTGTVPGPNDDVTVAVNDSGGLFPYSSITAPIHVRSVTVTKGTVLIQSALTVDNAITIASGGTAKFFSDASISGTGSLTIAVGGTWTVNSNGGVPSSGDIFVPVTNYGYFAMSGGHDIGPTVDNFGQAVAFEGGNYYGKFTNEPGATLAACYIPSTVGQTANFGLVRSSTGVISAAEFVNKGFVFTGGTDPNPATGPTNYAGQSLNIYLDATPSIGGSWQSSRGPILLSAFDTATAPAVVAAPNFSWVEGTLEVRNLDLHLRGMSNGSSLRIRDVGTVKSVVTLDQARTSLQILQLHSGTLRLGTGGRVLRAADVGYASGATLDVGDGLFIDGNQPAYGLSSFPISPAPSPASSPAYADSLRATLGGDTLTVRVTNPASTRSDEGIAYAYGGPLASSYPGGTFNGEAIDSNDFVFRATLRGDTDLDRDVDFSDLLRIAKHYGLGTSNGVIDGNVDDPANATGAVNFSDLLLLAQTYGKSMTIPAALSVAAPAAKATATRKRTADSVLA